MHRVALAALIAAFSASAHADSIARQGDDWVRITARPCTNEAVLAVIGDKDRALDFRAARAKFQGKDYAACWTPIPGGVGLVYEDGDQGLIPERDLKPEQGA